MGNDQGHANGNKMGSTGARISRYGIWTQHVWIFWMNTNNDALPASVPWQSMYLVLSVTMIAAAVFFGRRASASRSPIIDTLAAACAAAATLAAAAASFFPNAAFLSAAALVVGAMGFGVLYLSWGDFYSKIGVKRSVAYLFGGGMIAAFVKTVLEALPDPIAAIAAACIPFLSLVMCRAASADAPPPSGGAAFFTAQNIPALWKVAAVFVVFSIANASMLSLQPPYESVGGMPSFVAERALEFALCAGVLVYVFKLRKSFDFVQLWRIVLLILATDFLVNILNPGSAFQPFFAGVSLNFIVLFVWLVLADVSHCSNVPPILVFGIGWSCYTLPFFVGSLIVILGGFTVQSTGYFAVLMYAVALTAAFLLETRDQNTRRIFLDLDENAHAAPEDFTSIDQRCADIGRKRGLTAREIEVMQMLCKGRSKAYIAETLFVTENTVKGHAKRLYTKLDVHSKKELQQLVDAY